MTFQRNLQNQSPLLILCMKGSFFRHKHIDIMDCSSINVWLLRRLHVDYDRRENSTWAWSKTVVCSRNTWIMYLPCGTKFLRVLIFEIFPAIRKNKFPQIKTIANIFSANIYSRVNIKFAAQNTILKHRVCSITTRASFIKKHNSIQWTTGLIILRVRIP